ncbi:MAG: cupin domain-containing protein [Bacteroidia bacterium]
MKSLNEYINSGILEMYVLGLTSDEETSEIKKMAIDHSEINDEIVAIAKALMLYSEESVPAIDPTVKPMIMATIDYSERLKNGERPTVPPILTEGTTLKDLAPWLDRKDMALDEELEDFKIKIIGHQPNVMTAIVWIKEATPYEIHNNEYEKFLIIEGTCDIITDESTHSLVPGNYFSLPLHLGHVVKVTSKTPCKVILQRIAA